MGDIRNPRVPVLFLVLLLGGCRQEDQGTLAQIGKKLAGRLEAIAGDMKEEVGTAWPKLAHAGLEGRVAARLRWDKVLAGTSIEVKSQGADIELRGTVKDPIHKRRAVELAEETIGVERVIDHLETVETIPPAEEKNGN
jgi:hyperosmotically inducible protein